jgi:hypothetical protein
MKTNVLLSLCALVMSVSVATASASEKVTVQAVRGLRVAVIDKSNEFGARAPIRQALELSFSAGLTSVCKVDMPVRLKLAEETRAAADLTRGAYDGVVVIGNSVPSDFLKSGIVVLKANNASSKDLNRTFYLLARDDDRSLQDAMGAAFDLALASPSFQQALSGNNASLASVASAVR